MGNLHGSDVETVASEVNDDAILNAFNQLVQSRPSVQDALLLRLSSHLEFQEPVGSATELAEAPGVSLTVASRWNRPCQLQCLDPDMFAIQFPAASRLEFIVNDLEITWSSC